MTLDKVIKALLKRRHGAHVVVTKHAGESSEHSANLVNIRGKIYLVDAYTKPAIFTANFTHDWPHRIESSRTWDIRVVAREAVSEKTCD